VSKTFTTAAKRKQPIKFTLDPDTDRERELEFTPQKVTGLLGDVLPEDDDELVGESRPAKAAVDWLASGLSDDDENYLMGRLRDPDDDFDFPDLGRIIRWLVSEVTGRPTGKRRG
jgi:hypothetical protein